MTRTMEAPGPHLASAIESDSDPAVSFTAAIVRFTAAIVSDSDAIVSVSDAIVSDSDAIVSDSDAIVSDSDAIVSEAGGERPRIRSSDDWSLVVLRHLSTATVRERSGRSD